jgi:hypothetical protein
LSRFELVCFWLELCSWFFRREKGERTNARHSRFRSTRKLRHHSSATKLAAVIHEFGANDFPQLGRIFADDRPVQGEAFLESTADRRNRRPSAVATVRKVTR